MTAMTAKERLETAAKLHDLSTFCEDMARALEEDDGIMGSLAGMGLASVLPVLPKHVRDVFMEYLTDDAAQAVRAERLYWEAMTVSPAKDAA